MKTAQQASSPILITGAAGFIGSRLVESCNRLHIPLLCIDHLAHFLDRPQHRGLDFGQTFDIAPCLQEFAKGIFPFHNLQPRAIVHLGAITDTREADPVRLQTYNLECSKALWTYASQAQIPMVYASSAATYGAGEHGYDDDERTISKLHPLNLYGKSKQDFDLWALQQNQTPSKWAGLKFFNVYGFGENHKQFMSSVVLHSYNQILQTGKTQLFKSHREGIADGQQKRDFVYAEDVVEVIHFLIENQIQNGIYNLGSGKARSFFDLAQAVFRSLDHEENIQFIDTPLGIREQYQYFTEAPMQKLRKIGFLKPFTSLEDGVRAYIHRLRDETP